MRGSMLEPAGADVAYPSSRELSAQPDWQQMQVNG